MSNKPIHPRYLGENGIHRVPLWLLTAVASAVCTVIAVISFAPKDREEFFGTGKPVKVNLKDYWEVLKNNRAIQMLVLAASTDKLVTTAKTSAGTVAYLVGTVVQAGFQGISGNIVIPMTADCADYETYRSGKYVPGLMGTLFPFVDKIISSLAYGLIIVGLICNLIAMKFYPLTKDKMAEIRDEGAAIKAKAAEEGWFSSGVATEGNACGAIPRTFRVDS